MKTRDLCPVSGKRRYPTKSSARAASAASRGAGDTTTVRAYLCELCGAWHTTKKKK